MADSEVKMMELYLTKFGVDEVLGIYGQGKDRLAARMRYLHPEAARSFKKMDAEHRIKCSDMLRTAKGSRDARRRKNGRGLRAGWSGHNYGFSIDISWGWVMRQAGMNKVELDTWMASHGWYCHNIPGSPRDWEAWHYNYFGDEAEHFLSVRTKNKRTWKLPIAKKISEYYSRYWKKANSHTVQAGLKKLQLYKGAVDGIIGPQSKSAIKSFQREWDLDTDGVAGLLTKRTLLLVTAEHVLVDEAC